MAKKRITFYLDSDVHGRFKESCEKKGYVMSKKIQMLIEDYMEKSKK